MKGAIAAAFDIPRRRTARCYRDRRERVRPRRRTRDRGGLDPLAWAVARSPEGRDGSAAPRLIDEGQRHEDVADLFRVGRNTLSRVPLCQSEKYYALH